MELDSKDSLWIVILCVAIMIFVLLVLRDDPEDREYYSAKQRSNFYTVCRENDAVVLDSSMFWSEGTLYAFKKDADGKFVLDQRLDVSDYLKGDCVSFISQDEKGQFETFYSKQPIVYNDSYLVILTSKSTDPSDDGYYDGHALVFKRVGGNFEYYDRIKHILPYRVLLTNDNQLILCGRRNKFFSSEGSVLCYDLNKDKIKKVQTITPPTNIKNQLGRVIDSSKHDVRFGSDIQIGADDQTLLVECYANYRGVLDESMFDKIGSLVDAKIYLIYTRINNQWVFSQSTSELLPCSYYVNPKYQNSLSSIYNPLSYVTNVYIDADRIQFSCVDIMYDEKHLLEFTRNKETNLFEYSRYSLKEFIY